MGSFPPFSVFLRLTSSTQNCHNPYADAAVLTHLGNDTSVAAPPLHHGLSTRGRQLVREMNRLGMLVDISHVSAETMRDVLTGKADGEKPAMDDDNWTGSLAAPMFSHSSAYSICPHPRNVPDDVLHMVKKRGSVVMVNFAPFFISCKAPVEGSPAGSLPIEIPEGATLEKVADHIQYIGELIGYEHVGIGSDFDGISDVPRGLEDVSKMPELVAELLRRGVCEKELVGVVGGNVLRVWQETEDVGKRMRAEGAALLEDWENGWPGLGDAVTRSKYAPNVKDDEDE